MSELPILTTRAAPILDTRVNLVAVMVMAFGFSALSDLSSIPFMLGLTMSMVWWSGIPLRVLLHRLHMPGLLVLSLVIILPFTTGQTLLWQAGPVAVKSEGLAAALLITARFLAILSIANALLYNTPMSRIISALRALGVPWLMTDLALLMHRYLEELKKDLANMRLSMRLRGHPEGLSLANLNATGWLFASLLVRSYQRSDRIYRAMRLRGYGSAATQQHTFKVCGSDLAVLIVLAASVVTLILLEV